jgi:PAS domain S-box-containing protein
VSKIKDKPDMESRFLAETRDMIIACDPQRRITYANASASRSLGIPLRRLIGQDLLQGVEEFSQSLAEDLFDQVLANTHWHGELLLQRGDGQVFHAYISASPISDKSGEVERVLVIAQDISERKKLEEGVRKYTDLASSIIRTAPIGIFTLDTERKFRAVNKAFTDMVGVRNPYQLFDHPFDEISGILNPELIEAIESGLKGNETSVINKSLASGGPDDLTVTLTAVPIRETGDRVEAVLVLVENRTELVRVEEQLLQADKLASTGFLAAGIAHEINNPLAGIRTVIDTLANRVRREGGNEEPYQRILTNIDRVKDIIRRLLEFANPAAIQPQKSDINALVVQVLDFFKFHPIFRRISVEWNLDDNLPEIVIDPKQIQQIVHNLAMNAAQALKENGGRLEIGSHLDKSGDDGKNWIVITMRDTASGIPEEDLRRIFDPFFTTKPPGEGTGLGLSVSYSITKNHGGELLARNHPDGGAEFILRLPFDSE